MPAPPVGIGHLTMLDVAPPELVSGAADAGFDAVGVRAAVAAPGGEAGPVRVGSPMLGGAHRRRLRCRDHRRPAAPAAVRRQPGPPAPARPGRAVLLPALRRAAGRPLRADPPDPDAAGPGDWHRGPAAGGPVGAAAARR